MKRFFWQHRAGNRSISKRLLVALFAAVSLLASAVEVSAPEPSAATSSSKAIDVLNQLPVKGRAPKTGYSRDKFSAGWGDWGSCTVRDQILDRDLTNKTFRSDGCTVTSGDLQDPYTNATIHFVRGVGTSLKVQIDHVVAVSDAWQKGAQKLSSAKRYAFYNDPLNLLAVDGAANGQKSDSDAASWLPKNKVFRCSYVARQVAVKKKYSLWVTAAEKAAISGVLASCPGQKIPKR